MTLKIGTTTRSGRDLRLGRRLRPDRASVASRYANPSGTNVAPFSRSVFGQIGATFAAALFAGSPSPTTRVAGGIDRRRGSCTALLAATLEIWYLIVVAYKRAARHWRVSGPGWTRSGCSPAVLPARRPLVGWWCGRSRSTATATTGCSSPRPGPTA
ncbi:hypothetical protein HBB16_17950 [Pseudonocardia sp. MCCB 268]|nr:hypothetical protein [Pseudonocardia cytotoxica]